jgi:hypothetical protein
MAERERSVLTRQCLDERLPSLDRVRAVIAPWQQGCNEHRVIMQWRFTPADAREKLQRRSPSSASWLTTRSFQAISLLSITRLL